MNKFLTTRKIGDGSGSGANDGDQVHVAKKRENKSKKVIYLEIDDEVTQVYDRIKNLKIKNLYLVVPRRAILFQSAVNLRILKEKAEELEKNIFIITNDQNGLHVAKKVGLNVYDKLEGHEHPSLVSGKLLEDKQDITPLKASVNAMDDDTPTRLKDKKASITEMVKRSNNSTMDFIARILRQRKLKNQKAKTNPEEKGKLVLIAQNRQALISLVVVSLIILLTITYIALPGATITLTPKSSVLITSSNITLADIDLNKALLDTNSDHMVASYTITKKIDKVLTYQATGKDFKGQNASGTVTIFNVSDNPWQLVENTRFQTDDGIIFRIKSKLVVPAVKGNQPGTLDAPVIADPMDAYNQVVGDRGNIAANVKLFLPGLSEDNRKKINAVSKNAFIGGSTDVSKHILKEDLDAAKAKMTQDLTASAQAELDAAVKQKNATQGTDLVLLTGQNAIQTTAPVVSISNATEGQKVDNFDVKGQIVATGTAYSKDDIMAILRTELKIKKNPEKKLIHVDDGSVTYRIIDQDQNTRQIKLTFTIKGIEEYELSPDKENGDRLIQKIKEHVVNKNVDDAVSYIENLPEVDKVKINVWPAWSPTLPGLADNIKIDVNEADN